MTEEKHGKMVIHADIDLEDLIPGFLENRRKDIVEIENLLASDDYETIQRLGHSMKGAGGGYGFDEITNIGMHIEQASKEKNAGEIRIQMETLSRYLDCIEVVYD
jgi:HPt (histidine-containing phosphotransfer) domain-containing protein